MGVEVYCIVTEEASCDPHDKHIVSVELEKPLLWSATGKVVFSERQHLPVAEARSMLENGAVLYIDYGGRRLPLQKRTLSCDHETVRPAGKLVDIDMLTTCSE